MKHRYNQLVDVERESEYDAELAQRLCEDLDDFLESATDDDFVFDLESNPKITNPRADQPSVRKKFSSRANSVVAIALIALFAGVIALSFKPDAQRLRKIENPANPKASSVNNSLPTDTLANRSSNNDVVIILENLYEQKVSQLVESTAKCIPHESRAIFRVSKDLSNRKASKYASSLKDPADLLSFAETIVNSDNVLETTDCMETLLSYDPTIFVIHQIYAQ